MRVLITSGGTREYIDDVRYISNISTGKTARIIANVLSEVADITMLKAKDAIAADIPNIIEFESANDLEALLKNELKSHYDFVIHMAAISDYTVDKTNGKLDSSEELTLKLKRNKKILPEIKSYSSNSDLKLIGFKLTSNADANLILEKVRKVQNSGADYVVHNDLAHITASSHPSEIYYRGESFMRGESKEDLANNLKKIIMNRSL